jgi:predicted kinase
MVRASKNRIVLVSGPPGAGKTTLARPLAARLGFALLTKDDIKESLWTAMAGEPGDAAFSRRIGAAAMELLWSLAPQCPAVVLEANFRAGSPYERDRVQALLHSGAQMVEVHCRIPLDEASRRFAGRARQERHHPAHVLQEMSPQRLAEFEAPFALSPVIEVDTTAPIGLDALLARVENLFPSAP